MTIVEFVGFAITMLLLFFLFVKRMREERFRQQHPKQYEKKQKEAIRQLLKSLEIEVEEEEEPAEVPPEAPQQRVFRQEKSRRTVGKDFDFHSEIEKEQNLTGIDERELTTNIEQRYKQPYARKVVSQDMRPAVPLEDPYEIKNREYVSSSRRLVEGLKSPKDMILLHEIIGRPKWKE